MLTGTRRTVLMLAGCQALSMTGGSIVGLTGAIVGNMLTPDKALSTLPIAVQQAGVMAATIPAASQRQISRCGLAFPRDRADAAGRFVVLAVR